MSTNESMIAVGPNQTLIFVGVLINSKAYLFHNILFEDGDIFYIWMVWLKCDGGDYKRERTLWLKDSLIYHGKGSYNRRLII